MNDKLLMTGIILLIILSKRGGQKAAPAPPVRPLPRAATTTNALGNHIVI